MISINIPGCPTPLKRHRSCIVGHKLRNYDSQKIKKSAVQSLIWSELIKSDQRDILSYEFYEVNITFVFYKPGCRLYLNSWGFETPHDEKPDVDNLIKFVLDCGNGLLWKDDCRVTSINSRKMWGPKSCTVLEIMPKKISSSEIDPLTDKVLEEFLPDEIKLMIRKMEVLSYYLNDFENSTTIERANGIASGIKEIACEYGDKLMRIKKKMNKGL